MDEILVDLKPDQSCVGNRCSCPQRLLTMFDMSSSEPMILRIEGITENAYLTAYEFHGDGDDVLVPHTVFDRFRNEVYIQAKPATSIPTISFVKVEALDDDRVTKEMLEQAIPEYYQVISLGDVLVVGGWRLKVVELEPSDVVRTYNSDPEIAFVPKVREVEPYADWLERARRNPEMWKYPRLCFNFT